LTDYGRIYGSPTTTNNPRRPPVADTALTYDTGNRARESNGLATISTPNK